MYLRVYIEAIVHTLAVNSLPLMYPIPKTCNYIVLCSQSLPPQRSTAYITIVQRTKLISH